jgi:hypothetical protein
MENITRGRIQVPTQRYKIIHNLGEINFKKYEMKPDEWNELEEEIKLYRREPLKLNDWLKGLNHNIIPMKVDRVLYETDGKIGWMEVKKINIK